MNSLMTAGLHHRWRRRAVDLARVGPGGEVLDVASGTGDLAIELSARVGQSGSVIGSDFSEQMLDRARIKAPQLEWVQRTRSRCPTRTIASTRSRWASARAISPISMLASLRWCALRAPAAESSC